MYCIQHYSDAGIEPRNVAVPALTVRAANPVYISSKLLSEVLDDLDSIGNGMTGAPSQQKDTKELTS
jgi:hypothetical protein